MRTRQRETRTGRHGVWPVLALAFGLPALLYLAGWGITGAHFKSELARLKAQGEPLTPHDLVPKLARGERNAAEVYAQAFALAPSQGLDRLYASGTWRWNQRDLPLARRIVDGNRQYFRLLDEASRLPACSLQLDWDGRGRWQVAVTQTLGFTKAFQALSVRAQVRAHDGDLDGALASCAGLLRMAGHLAQIPGSGEGMASSVVESVALEDIEAVLSTGDPSPAALRQLANQLAARDHHALLVGAMRAQRVAGLARMRWMERGQWFVQSPPRSVRWVVREGYPVVARPLWNAEKDRYLEVMAAYIAAARRPWPEAGKEVVHLDGQARRLFSSGASPMARVAPDGQLLFGLAGRDAAIAGAWQVALALKAYHHEHGAYPATVAQAEHSGWKLPDDPFTGKPYHYRRDGSGFVVWSVGFDLKDNGARPLPTGWDDYMSPGYDFDVRCAR